MMRHSIYYFISLMFLSFISQIQASNLKKIELDLSDSLITTKITARFTESKNINPLKISVSTTGGVVQLSGYVKDKQAFVDALRIAKTTHGVKSVRANNLYIKKVNTAFTDAFITAKVETAVLKAKVLDDESIPLVGINATTTNGVVTLSGQVTSAQSIAAIIKRVNAIQGVKKIIPLLEIKDRI
jgi:hyperosmotically inducible protein